MGFCFLSTGALDGGKKTALGRQVSAILSQRHHRLPQRHSVTFGCCPLVGDFLAPLPASYRGQWNQFVLTLLQLVNCHLIRRVRGFFQTPILMLRYMGVSVNGGIPISNKWVQQKIPLPNGERQKDWNHTKISNESKWTTKNTTYFPLPTPVAFDELPCWMTGSVKWFQVYSHTNMICLVAYNFWRLFDPFFQWFLPMSVAHKILLDLKIQWSQVECSGTCQWFKTYGNQHWYFFNGR